MHCAACDTANPSEAIRCVKCNAALPALETAGPGAVETLIPYRNKLALAGYYLGFASIFPIFGILFACFALTFGILGLNRAVKYPESRGLVHAVIGIVLGMVSLACNPPVGTLAWLCYGERWWKGTL
jgi:hypothetical protein